MKFLCLVLVFLPAITYSQTQECTNGRIYQTCGTACPLTCDNHLSPPLFCTFNCVSDCFCPSGLVELGDQCVAPADCPTTASTLPPPPPTTPPPPTPPPTPTCTNGMIFNECGTACPLTCKYPEPRPCIRLCVRGCFCPSGMLEYNGGCVAPNDCPAITTLATVVPSTAPVCTNGKVFESCGTLCPVTCENRNDPPVPCPAVCVSDCFCPSGTVEHAGSCYHPDDCPTPAPPTPTPPPTCGNGMTYNRCGTACPLTCEFPDPRPCPLICAEGCFCPEGLLEYHGRCVTRSECPAPVCTNGMVYESCGTFCPITCENVGNPPVICPEVCVSGCFCPNGMVEHAGSCYLPNECPTPAPPTPPICGNGMTYNRCGTACPLTCEFPDPRPCPRICAEGCFCPEGLLEYHDRCVTRLECPAPVCTNGMVHESCGTFCPITCENVGNPPIVCPDVCVEGCFCPNGMVEHAGSCYQPNECPIATTVPPTALTTTTDSMSCSNGMEFRQCGPLCPPTCNGLRGCFSLRCAAGCFCPEGQYEHEGGCVDECPMVVTPQPPTRPTRPPVDSCALIDCLPQQYCLQGRCVNYTCAINNGRCQADQVCEMAASGCQPGDENCFRYTQCKDPPYVPCGDDAFLACDSEWTYCLQQNKTRRAECVSSCLSRNGNCDEDTVCVTTPGDSPRLDCVESNDLPKDCHAGQMMDQCGNLCQLTCEQHLTGLPIACPTVCAPPACSCPVGLALFRDRCVDPKLCYVLVNYPPAIKPLPIVEPNTVLLSLHGDRMNRETFMRRRQELLESIERALSDQGLHVVARIHGVHFDDDDMQIVIELSGSDISSESAETLAEALRRNSHLLIIDIQRVDSVDAEYIDREDPEEQGLSQSAIIGIAVSSGVAGLAVIVAWIAVVTCCCVLSGRSSRSLPPPGYKNQSYEYPTVPLTEKIDPEKGKMLREGMEMY